MYIWRVVNIFVIVGHAAKTVKVPLFFFVNEESEKFAFMTALCFCEKGKQKRWFFGLFSQKANVHKIQFHLPNRLSKNQGFITWTRSSGFRQNVHHFMFKNEFKSSLTKTENVSNNVFPWNLQMYIFQNYTKERLQLSCPGKV